MQNQLISLVSASMMPRYSLAELQVTSNPTRFRLKSIIANCDEADWCVGELLKTLEEEGLLENTLIVFSSDNGPWGAFEFMILFFHEWLNFILNSFHNPKQWLDFTTISLGSFRAILICSLIVSFSSIAWRSGLLFFFLILIRPKIITYDKVGTRTI